MITTFKARARKLADGMQVETQSRSFKVIIDEPTDLGGTDVAMSPVEILLCSLGACQAIVAAAFAPAHDITFRDFYVDIEGDLDLDGFMGLSDVRKGFQEIRYQMHFDSDEPIEKLEKFANFIEETCPVGDSIGNAVKLVNSGVVRD